MPARPRVLRLPETRRQDGFALITVVLIAMVLTMLGTLVLTVSVHDTRQSARNRGRMQGVAAAEAGIDRVLSLIQRSSLKNLPCDKETRTLDGAPSASEFQVTSTYFDESGQEIDCTDLEYQVPASVMIHSQGAGASSTARAMESMVDLEPTYGGFESAILSGSDLKLQNRLTVNGDVGSDADIYTAGNLAIDNASDIQGSVYARGWIDISNRGTIDGTVWGNDWVKVSGNRLVKGDVISSTSWVAINNPTTVNPGGARAGTSLSCSPPDSGPCTGTSPVFGTKSESSPTEPLQGGTLPKITGDTAPWTSEEPPYVVYTFSGSTACTDAKSFIDTWPESAADERRLVRITEPCLLEWSTKASTTNVRNDLAILTDGALAFRNNVTFQGPPARAKLYLTSVWQEGVSCDSGTRDITKENLAKFLDLDVFMYTPCTLYIENNTSELSGQVLAGTVVPTGNLTLTYRVVTVPGAHVVGFLEKIRYKREIRLDQ